MTLMTRTQPRQNDEIPLKMVLGEGRGRGKGRKAPKDNHHHARIGGLAYRVPISWAELLLIHRPRLDDPDDQNPAPPE
jgi:hypothetical protein